MLREFEVKTEEMRTGVKVAAEAAIRDSLGKADQIASESMEKASRHLAALEIGIATLNGLLQELSGKQVVVNVSKKKGWFGIGSGS